MTENTRISQKQIKKKRRRKKLLFFLVIPLAIILLSGTAYGYHLYTKAQNVAEGSFEDVNRDDNKSDLRDEIVNPVEDSVSVLIIGVDDSEKRDYDGHSRSDTLMLATFNKAKNDVKLVSIPRDSYVYVPEVGYKTKINAAHAFGGPEATIETVERFMNVPVDYYVRVNFEAFMEVVNSLDGIKYDVPYEIVEQNSNDKEEAIHLKPGLQKLNGEEALALARTRKYDNDIKRSERQQEIIKTVVDKAASASSVFKVSDLLEAVGDNMATNLTFDNMRSFIGYGLSKNVSIETMTLKGNGGFSDAGPWYYYVDEQSRANAEKELRSNLDLSSTETELTVEDQETPSY